MTTYCIYVILREWIYESIGTYNDFLRRFLPLVVLARRRCHGCRQELAEKVDGHTVSQAHSGKSLQPSVERPLKSAPSSAKTASSKNKTKCSRLQDSHTRMNHAAARPTDTSSTNTKASMVHPSQAAPATSCACSSNRQKHYQHESHRSYLLGDFPRFQPSSSCIFHSEAPALARLPIGAGTSTLAAPPRPPIGASTSTLFVFGDTCSTPLVLC